MSGSESYTESQESASFDATPLPLLHAENCPSNSNQNSTNNSSQSSLGADMQVPHSSSSGFTSTSQSSNNSDPILSRNSTTAAPNQMSTFNESHRNSTTPAPNQLRRTSTTSAPNQSRLTSTTFASIQSRRSSTTAPIQSRRSSTTAPIQSRRSSTTLTPYQTRHTSIIPAPDQLHHTSVPNQSCPISTTPVPNRQSHNSAIPSHGPSNRTPVQGQPGHTSATSGPYPNSTAPAAPPLRPTSANSALRQPHHHSTPTSNLAASRSNVSSNNLTTGSSVIQSGDLPTLFKLQQQTLEMVKKVEKRMEKLESSVTLSFTEIKKILLDQQKKSFSIKESIYELDLRSAMGELFCDSLTRYPDDEKIRATVRSVLTEDDQNKKYILVAALRNCRETLSNFRTEERRKILGIPPYERSCFRSTADLSKEMMEYMKAPEHMYSVYVRHLALLRKYVRNTPTSMTEMRFHEKAKRWVTSTPSLSEQDWEALMEEDAQHPYHEFPTSNPVGQQNVEEEIVTDNFEHDDLNANNLQGGSYGEEYGGYEEHVYSGAD